MKTHARFLGLVVVGSLFACSSGGQVDAGDSATPPADQQMMLDRVGADATDTGPVPMDTPVAMDVPVAMGAVVPTDTPVATDTPAPRDVVTPTDAPATVPAGERSTPRSSRAARRATRQRHAAT